MLAISRRTKDKPLGSALLVPGHPLGSLCKFALLCNDNAALLRDAIGGLPLTANQSATFGAGIAATGPKCDVNGKGFQATLPGYLKPASAVTMFWRGMFISNPSVNSNIFCALYDAVATSPFIPYGIFEASIGGTAFGIDSGGTFSNVPSGATPVSVRMTDYTGIYDGTNVAIYTDGKQSATQAAAGSLSYTATSQIALGNDTARTTVSANCITDCAYIFPNVALTASEIWDLHNDPFGMWQSRSGGWFNKVVAAAGVTPWRLWQRIAA